MPNVPNLLASALWWAQRSVPVFPLFWPVDGRCVCGDGRCTSPGKHPLTAYRGTWYTHRGLHDATIDPATIVRWWRGAPEANIGLRTGVVYDVIDIDGPGGEASYKKITTEHGVPFHVAETRTGRLSGGRHLLVPTAGVKALAGGRTSPAGIDVKGTGGYVIAPDSLHVSGNRYAWKRHLSESRDVGTVPWPEFYQLLKDAAPAKKPEPVAVPPDRPRTSLPLNGSTTAYGAKVLANAVALVRAQHEGSRWQTVATEALVTIARAVDGQCLDRGQALRELADAGRAIGLADSEVRRFDQLLDDLLAKGIRNPIAPNCDLFAGVPVLTVAPSPAVLAPAVEPVVQTPAPVDEVAEQASSQIREEVDDQAGGDDEAPKHTSWWPADLEAILTGTDDGNPKPVALARDDGQHLLYPGRVNMLIGESESGKTWIALHGVAQALSGGESVVYLDFEDSAAGVVGRLLALGVEPDRIRASLRYISPDEGYSLNAAADLTTVIADTYPSVVIVDGVNAGMGLCGLDLNSNKDVTAFGQRVLRPLARTGAAVLGIDHVTKSKEGRGSYAIGAQAKRADVNGAAFLVEVVKPFGRGMTGKLRITVSKDRPGHVRAASAGAKHAGTAVITSNSETGAVEMVIEAPKTVGAAADEAPAVWRPTALMERVSRFLEGVDGTPTVRTIVTEVPGRSEHLRAAVDALTADGYVRREAGARGALHTHLVRPFREATDGLIDARNDEKVIADTVGTRSTSKNASVSRPCPDDQGPDQDLFSVSQRVPACPDRVHSVPPDRVPTPPPFRGGTRSGTESVADLESDTRQASS